MMETRSSLLRRVRNPADADGWREFVALYEPLLLAYVRKKGLRGPDADDVVQEALARLVKALPDFDLERGRGRFRTWLWRVTCNALADRARRGRRQALAEQAWAEDAGTEPPEAWRSADDREPEADWLALHRRRVLEFAKAQVRSRSRARTWACFEEHVLRGRSSAEVAAELGVTINVVDVNSSRILSRLRTYCRHYLEELADGDDALPG
jgi:RNA polymerase sigma factor (sigma-70 family)